MNNFKDINIGELICRRVKECKLERDRICNFLKCSENEIAEMYKAKSLDTALLLRWCKLLEYDFFRIYTQHIILYAPSGNYNTILNENVSRLPKFKKNIYTREVIDFILERIVKGEMTRLQVINEYKIPKTTLYKWIEKYAV